MTFKPLDPELARSLLKGHEDVITPATKVENELYELVHCPVCGEQGADRTMLPPKVVMGENGPVMIRTPFSNTTPIVKTHAKCRTCGTEYDAYTRVIIAEPSEPVITSVQ